MWISHCIFSILGDAIPLETSGWSAFETAITPCSLLLGLRTTLRRLERFSGTRMLRRPPRVRATTGRRDGLQVGVRRSTLSYSKVQFLTLFFDSVQLSYSQEKLFREPDSYIYINAQFNSVISTVTAAAITSLCNNKFFSTMHF